MSTAGECENRLYNYHRSTWQSVTVLPQALGVTNLTLTPLACSACLFEWCCVLDKIFPRLRKISKLSRAHTHTQCMLHAWGHTHSFTCESTTAAYCTCSNALQGDEEWALGWLASLLDDEEITLAARRHVRNFGRFRSPDNCVINSTAVGAVSARCMRLEAVITWVRL